MGGDLYYKSSSINLHKTNMKEFNGMGTVIGIVIVALGYAIVSSVMIEKREK